MVGALCAPTAVMYEGTNTNRIPFHQRLVFAPSYIAAAAVGGQSNGRYPEVRFHTGCEWIQGVPRATQIMKNLETPFASVPSFLL